MVFGELVAQYLAIAVPLQTARVVAGPQVLFSKLVTPLIRLTNGAANAVLHRLGIEPTDELQFGPFAQELVAGADLGQTGRAGSAHGGAGRPFPAVRRTQRRGVHDPRSKIESLEADDTVGDLLAMVRDTGHSVPGHPR